MNIPYLLACARDWQRIKQAYALDHAGTADGNQALVDSRRIGELADAVQHLDSALRDMIRVHCVDDDEYDTESATDRIYRLTLMISAARSMLAGGEAPKDTVDHLPDRSAANRLRAVLETISELAAWHADDDADPANPSPEDQVAHINGLIRRACTDALSNTEDGAPARASVPKRIDMLTFDEIENCMPDGACSDPSTGEIRVSSQWLHDYAHAVAQAEREACARFIEHCDRGTVEFSACKILAAAIRQPPK